MENRWRGDGRLKGLTRRPEARGLRREVERGRSEGGDPKRGEARRAGNGRKGGGTGRGTREGGGGDEVAPCRRCPLCVLSFILFFFAASDPRPSARSRPFVPLLGRGSSEREECDFAPRPRERFSNRAETRQKVGPRSSLQPIGHRPSACTPTQSRRVAPLLLARFSVPLRPASLPPPPPSRRSAERGCSARLTVAGDAKRVAGAGDGARVA